MTRALFTLLGVLAGAGCTRGSTEGPAPIKFDRDICRGCGMVISDKRFAAEVRGGPDGRITKFDDVGCALKWLEAQTFANDPATRIWVASQDDGHFLEARRAHFVDGAHSPMGYGFAAVEEPRGLDFEMLREHLRSRDAGPTAKGRTP